MILVLYAHKEEEGWLGRRDSNPRVSAPEADALPLGYSPMPVSDKPAHPTNVQKGLLVVNGTRGRN